MPIFVFGSNLAGRHGKGAALFAYHQHGAVYGQAVGLQGNSFAIPTKDQHIQTLPINKIKIGVNFFIEFATYHSDLTFDVTRIGCGLAGYHDADIAPLFYHAPSNCILPPAWELIIQDLHVLKQAQDLIEA